MFVDLFHVKDDIDFDRMGMTYFLAGKVLTNFGGSWPRALLPHLPLCNIHRACEAGQPGPSGSGFFQSPLEAEVSMIIIPLEKIFQVVATWNIDAENPQFWWLFMAFHGFSTSMDCKRLQEGDIL